MATVNKQDSNFTDLRYSVETSPGVAGSTWYPLEPNSYKNFGASVKTKQRMPINATRQLNKPVVVDVDAQGSFVQDLTADNFQDIAQCVMYAALRTKTELSVATVDGTGNAYQPASGGASYQADDLLFAKGFDNTPNKGLKKVSGVPTASNIDVTDTGLTSETGASGIISRVGFEFASGIAAINATPSDYPRFEVANVAATGTYTLSGNVSNGNTVTIGTTVYTFKTALTPTAGEVFIGATASDSLDNLIAAINHAAGGGTLYAAATVIDPNVTAAAGAGDTMVVTAKVTGQVGNHIASTEVGANSSWGATTLAGGVGRDLSTLGLVPGEFVYIGSDETNTSFSDDEDNGFCRIRSIETNALVFDKTQFIMVDNSGTSKTIRLYFGRVLKNESDPTLIIKRGIQIERTLGAPDDAQPTQIQAEYLVRSLLNNCKFDFKTADIVRTELEFLSNTTELRTGATGVKSGARPSLEDTDAFNTTGDVSVTKVCVVTDGDSCPTPLFSFFTDMVIDVKNNVKQNKAIKVLGAFDSTPGFFQVQATLTAYFVSVSEMQSVIDNESVTVETHMAKFNKGVSIDVPLMVLSDANADVKLNEPIMLPLKSDAARSRQVNPDTDHTFLMVFWDYLPDVAE
jgi:hypothetical protein